MKLLFISVWTADSGIFQSTIPPEIDYWLENGIIKHVDVVTIDHKVGLDLLKRENVSHKSIVIDLKSSSLKQIWTQLTGLWSFTKNKNYDLIWARGVTSGNLAFFVSKYKRTKFGVESFEPHTDYMVEGGTWAKNSIKTKVQHFLEKRQAQEADILITVSKAYADLIPTKFHRTKSNVYSMACAIDFEKFKFDVSDREKVRTELQFSNEEKIGVYAGKFGDIYYDDEFFSFIKSSIAQHDQLKFLVLTPMIEHAEQQKKKFGIEDDRLTILSVGHSEVPQYLSASDFGICPVKESPSRRYCSPIKTGEYYANGLPVVISRGIGDDSDYIIGNHLGQVIDFGQNIPLKMNLYYNEARERKAKESAIKFRSKTNLFPNYKNIMTGFAI